MKAIHSEGLLPHKHFTTFTFCLSWCTGNMFTIWILHFTQCWFIYRRSVQNTYVNNSFKKFPKFTGIIYRNCYCEEGNVHWHPLPPYVCGQKEIHQTMENQQLVSTSWQCSRIPNAFCQGFLSKEQCDNTGVSPIHSWHGSIWFLPVPSNWRDSAFAILVTSLRMWLKSLKGFHKMASRTVTVAGRRLYLH